MQSANAIWLMVSSLPLPSPCRPLPTQHEPPRQEDAMDTEAHDVVLCWVWFLVCSTSASMCWVTCFASTMQITPVHKATQFSPATLSPLTPPLHCYSLASALAVAPSSTSFSLRSSSIRNVWITGAGSAT